MVAILYPRLAHSLAKYGWSGWVGRLAWWAASQSIARNSADPRLVMRPYASRSPD